MVFFSYLVFATLSDQWIRIVNYHRMLFLRVVLSYTDDSMNACYVPTLRMEKKPCGLKKFYIDQFLWGRGFYPSIFSSSPDLGKKIGIALARQKWVCASAVVYVHRSAANMAEVYASKSNVPLLFQGKSVISRYHF